MTDELTNEQLAEAAYATETTRRALEHQLRMLAFSRVSPGREDEFVRLAHQSADRGETLAEEALQQLDGRTRGELIAIARRDVRMALLAAANSVLLTARLLGVEDGEIAPEQVALFAACPVGWIRNNYTAVPPADSWVWRSAPEDRRA